MSSSTGVIVKPSHNERDAYNLRRFYRVQHACAKLQDAIKVLYENATPLDELQDMYKNGNSLERAIGRSPAMYIASYLSSARDTLDIESIFDHYEFRSDTSPVDAFIRYPVVSDPYLENLAFIHRSYPNMNVKLTETQKTMMSNERLEFLGDSWLGALVALILYQKYPTSNEGALSKMKSAIVNNSNLEKICQRLGFKERLKENIPKSRLKVKDRYSKHYADCVEAYIGALVVDRFSTELRDIYDWIAELAQEQFKTLGPEMVKKPLNKNAKGELSELLQFNRLGQKLTYETLTSTSPFIVQVLLGDTVLAKGEGSSIREAEQRAAMEVLEDTKLLQDYCLYELEPVDKDNELMLEDIEEPISPGFVPQLPSKKESSTHDIDSSSDDSNESNFVDLKIERKKSPSNVFLQSRTPPLPERPTSRTKSSNRVSTPEPSSHTDDIESITSEMVSKLNEALAPILTEAVTRASQARLHPQRKLHSLNEESSRSKTSLYTDDKLSDSSYTTSTTSSLSRLDTSDDSTKYNNQDYDKEASGRLYILLGSRHLFPQYDITEKGRSKFHAVCSVKGLGIYLGEGYGRSRKISQHVAAENALNGPNLRELLGDF